MFKRLLKSLTCMFLSVIMCIFGFASCQDLGEDVKTEDDYYDLFPSVTMIDVEGDKDTVDMEDIYNKDTSDNLTSPYDTDKEYVFMVIEVVPPSGQTLTIDSLAMFILYSGETTVGLDAYCFIGNDDLYDKLTDDEHPFDMNSEVIAGKSSVTLQAKSTMPNAKQPQNSFSLTFTKSDFTDDGIIVIMFKRRKDTDKIAFRPTNVMIHTNSLG